jgi:hypothetical protein
MGQDSDGFGFVVKLRVNLHCQNVSFNCREVVRECDATHEHKVFLIKLRMPRELDAGFLDSQSSEHFPRMVGIQATTGGIEIALSRKIFDIPGVGHNEPLDKFHVPNFCDASPSQPACRNNYIRIEISNRECVVSTAVHLKQWTGIEFLIWPPSKKKSRSRPKSGLKRTLR